jgi:hypothetical protein
MMLWTPNRITALLLGLWIAVAPALLVAPAAGLMFETIMVHDAGPDDCGCCSDAKPKRDLCASMCVNALPFATLRSNDLVATAFHDDYAVRRELTRSSRTIPPDPPPPKLR